MNAQTLRVRLATAVLTAGVACGATAADVVQYRFSGLTYRGALTTGPFAGVPVGQRVNLDVTFDTLRPADFSSAGLALFELSLNEVTVSAGSISLSPPLGRQVITEYDPTVDTLIFNMTFGQSPAASQPDAMVGYLRFDIGTLRGTPGSLPGTLPAVPPFDGFPPPGAGPDFINNFNYFVFQFFTADGTRERLVGAWDRIDVIPTPGAGMLAALGGVAMLRRRRDAA